MRKSTGTTPADLVMPPFPAPLKHLWAAFLALHQGRTYSMGGPNPLTYESILAWVTLTGTDLSAWDVEVIKTLDMIWLKAMSEDQNG